MKNRPLAGIRVLLAEDDADNAEMLAEMLAYYGAIVRTAATARAAIDFASSWTPDVLLLDLEMPEMSGYDLIREIRRIPAMGRAPVLAVTGRVSAVDKMRTLAAGFAAHVAKPIDEAALVGMIAKIAARRRQLEDSDSHFIP